MARGRAVRVIVVMDMKMLTIEQVYIGCSLKEATHAFMRTLQTGADAAYSDMRRELADALQRYQLVECDPSRVSMRRSA